MIAEMPKLASDSRKGPNPAKISDSVCAPDFQSPVGLYRGLRLNPCSNSLHHVVDEYIQAAQGDHWPRHFGNFLFAGFIHGTIPRRRCRCARRVHPSCSLGIIDSDGLFSVFSNTAPITIAAMFILSGALLRTGTIDAVAGFIIKRAETHPRLAVVEMFLGAFVASAFMNNTPVVLVLIPIILRLSRATGISSKKLLIPLSFICILGVRPHSSVPPPT